MHSLLCAARQKKTRKASTYNIFIRFLLLLFWPAAHIEPISQYCTRVDSAVLYMHSYLEGSAQPSQVPATARPWRSANHCTVLCSVVRTTERSVAVQSDTESCAVFMHSKSAECYAFNHSCPDVDIATTSVFRGCCLGVGMRSCTHMLLSCTMYCTAVCAIPASYCLRVEMRCSVSALRRQSLTTERPSRLQQGG